MVGLPLLLSSCTGRDPLLSALCSAGWWVAAAGHLEGSSSPSPALPPAPPGFVCFSSLLAPEHCRDCGPLAGDLLLTDVVPVTGLAACCCQGDLRAAGPDTSLHLSPLALQGCPTPLAWSAAAT